MNSRDIQIKILYDNLPEGVNGMCTKCGSDKEAYMIILDSKQAERQQALAFLHEALHIYRQDFTSGKTAQEIEAEAHAFIEAFLLQA